MDSMLNCIIRSFKEVHKNRIIALKITESLKRNKALSEENYIINIQKIYKNIQIKNKATKCGMEKKHISAHAYQVSLLFCKNYF